MCSHLTPQTKIQTDGHVTGFPHCVGLELVNIYYSLAFQHLGYNTTLSPLTTRTLEVSIAFRTTCMIRHFLPWSALCFAKTQKQAWTAFKILRSLPTSGSSTTSPIQHPSHSLSNTFFPSTTLSGDWDRRSDKLVPPHGVAPAWFSFLSIFLTNIVTAGPGNTKRKYQPVGKKNGGRPRLCIMLCSLSFFPALSLFFPSSIVTIANQSVGQSVNQSVLASLHSIRRFY